MFVCLFILRYVELSDSWKMESTEHKFLWNYSFASVANKTFFHRYFRCVIYLISFSCRLISSSYYYCFVCFWFLLIISLFLYLIFVHRNFHFGVMDFVVFIFIFILNQNNVILWMICIWLSILRWLKHRIHK